MAGQTGPKGKSTVMNQRQLRVVEEVWSGSAEGVGLEWPAPILLTGPFGTGKAFTLAQVACRVLGKGNSSGPSVR